MRARAGSALVWEGTRDRGRWLYMRLAVGLGGKSGWLVGERRRGLVEKEGASLGRDAWAAGGEAGEKADGSAVGAMAGGMGLGRAGQCWRSRSGDGRPGLEWFQSKIPTKPIEKSHKTRHFGRRKFAKFCPSSSQYGNLVHLY